jgi:hypothetical protein
VRPQQQRTARLVPALRLETAVGALLYLKQNASKRKARPKLPTGQTLDSIWEKFGDRCVLCSAPKLFLDKIGIGRQVHHVAPYSEKGHRGPLVPICTHCHEVANARQRIYLFLWRVVFRSVEGVGDDVKAKVDIPTPASTGVLGAPLGRNRRALYAPARDSRAGSGRRCASDSDACVRCIISDIGGHPWSPTRSRDGDFLS